MFVCAMFRVEVRVGGWVGSGESNNPPLSLLFSQSRIQHWATGQDSEGFLV